MTCSSYQASLLHDCLLSDRQFMHDCPEGAFSAHCRLKQRRLSLSCGNAHRSASSALTTDREKPAIQLNPGSMSGLALADDLHHIFEQHKT